MSLPIHKLSNKSTESGRDTFIFLAYGPYVRLIAGFNQGSIQAEAATVYRWLRVLTQNTQRERSFELRPVALMKCEQPFRYVYPSELGDRVAEDENIMDPGDYGWFWTGEDVGNLDPNVPFTDGTLLQYSFADLARDVATDDQLQLCEIDASREERVEARDINCFFMRRSEKHELKVAWIIPPAWFSQVDNEGENALPYQKDENAILLWKGLESHWNNNEFAVDVQDNYRIVRFRSLQEEESVLPQHLPRVPGPAMEVFLRKHFDWCLRVNLEAGDISEEVGHTDRAIASFCANMGLAFIEDDKKRPRAPQDHKGWETPIGKEYLILEAMGLTEPDEGVDIEY